MAHPGDDPFTVFTIPHIYEVTIVHSTWTECAAVNLEFDLIGKYVAPSLRTNGETPAPDALAEEWLKE